MQLSRKHILASIGVMMIAVSLVTVLAWRAVKPTYKKNGFKRNFLATTLEQVSITKKYEDVLDISGVSQSTIYFKTTNPGKLFTTDRKLQKKKYITLKAPVNEKIASAFSVEVDSPFVYITANNGPGIIKGNLIDKNLTFYQFPAGIFTKSARISNSEYIIRGFDSTLKGKGQLFIKGSPELGTLTRKQGLIDQNGDVMGLATDGYLLYDKVTKHLIYVLFYQNTFYCFDTGFNKLYTGKTIDTVSANQLHAGIVSNNVYSRTNAIRTVNDKGTVANGILFNISRLNADNEEPEAPEKETVIDMYSIKNGSYEGSFYIPHIKKQRVRYFKIVDDYLIALYNKTIAIYKLPFKITTT